MIRSESQDEEKCDPATSDRAVRLSPSLSRTQKYVKQIHSYTDCIAVSQTCA